MHYDVPFISQFKDIADPDWQWRGCGIVALKMILDFWHAKDPANQTADIEQLWQMGMDADAYREGIGWTHGGLAAIARQLGYRSYNRDFAPNSPTPRDENGAWSALARELDRGPVLASMYSGMDPSRGGGHIVVVTGTEDELVLLNDPEQHQEREGKRALARKKFREAFKRRYIYVLPEISVR
jgi:hypothetical protein